MSAPLSTPSGLERPRHPNTANETSRYQIAKKETYRARKSANHIAIALATRGAR